MVAQSPTRTLDEWYLQINRIYLDRNFHRDEFAIFGHLVEIVGGLSLLASEKEKPDVANEAFMAKAIAWWMALCGQVGVRSVEKLLWWKFPYLCPYCEVCPHDEDICSEAKAEGRRPNWERLEQRGSEREKPGTLGGWQRMYATIYRFVQTEDYPQTFARIGEELGELAEALRVFPAQPAYFLSEAADVFAWLMHLQEVIYHKQRIPRGVRGLDLDLAFHQQYPDKCKDCEQLPCICPPILPSTLGRIAHEAPEHRASFAPGGALLPPEEAMRLFEAVSHTIELGDAQLEATPRLIAEIHAGVRQLIRLELADRESSGQEWQVLIDVLFEVRQLTARQRVTQKSIDDLARAVSDLPSSSRQRFIELLSGITSSIWAEALIEAVKKSGI